MERLQKYIASCGIASRRKAEELITLGKVKVNGVVVTTLGTKVSGDDVVEVLGKTINKENKVYFVINKPRGVLCTVDDPKKRKTVIDILPDSLKQYRLFPVGRLDYDTKGVLILTNDGEFMNDMVGPSSGVEKEYYVRVKGLIGLQDIKKLSNGVVIDNKKTLPSIVQIISKDEVNKSTLLDIVITEGKYHQVKNMCEAIGFPVKKLTRVRFGHLVIEGLREGEVQRLSIHDIKVLHQLSKRPKVLKNGTK